ncbi:ras guanine nucleotide exchange factor a [Anaeramoeba flamelloides]|uniref:Ras guanine nucleotide exchange factor a n=1 Tax=Anaeramoeba flamelloides TaxID=1746091 RepID=A0AAV7YDD0_9EUKA|nr:ras guanine nucleotide exchange factor a [Anaeramoeba flamelloides]
MSKSKKVHIGDKVKVKNQKGTIRFIGKTKKKKKKIFYGIEFEEKVGDNDGTLEGTRYFTGKENHCVFIDSKTFKKLTKKKLKTKSDNDLNNSGSDISSTNSTQTTASSNTVSSSSNFSTSQESTPRKSRKSKKHRKKKKNHKKEKKKKEKEEQEQKENEELDELNEEERIRKEILEQWGGKEESLILKELEQINKNIHKLTNEQTILDQEIEIYENSLNKNTPLNFTEDHKERRNEKKKSLQNDIEELLESIKEQESLQEKQQNKINELIPKSKKIENIELVTKVNEKKKNVTKLFEYLEGVKDKNKNIQQQIKDQNSKINSKKHKHQLEIDEYKKSIDLMDLEILKAQERKKNFGKEILTKKGKEVLEKKITLLQKLIKYTKQQIFDLQLGKSLHSIKIKSVLEYQDQVDRRDWSYRVMKKNPELMDLRERINPLSRAISFTKYYSGAKVLVNELLTKQIINQLIMQHFEFEGKHLIREKIEEVMSIPYHDVQLNDSRLRTLLRIALREIENLWDLLMTDTSGFGPTKEERKNLLEGKIDELGLDMVADENEINIWNEPEDNPKNIIYNSGVDPKKIDKSARIFDIIHCANVNKLVEKLTNNQTEVRFRDAFIMTYQSFMKPEQLLGKLKQRYNAPPKKQNENEKDWVNMKDMIQVRVVSALNSWIKSGWADIDNKLLYRLIDFIKTTIVPTRKASGEKLIKLINDMKASKETSGTHTIKDKIPQVVIPKNLFRNDFSLNDVDELEFARQFTLYIFELFQNIKPSELVTEAWQKKGLRSKATNVLALINKFNEYSNYVATQIVLPLTVKDRAKMYTRFLKIGKYFLEMNNFDSIMSTIGGYTNPSVKRLKKTIDEVPKNIVKYFNEFKNLLKHEQGYKDYRERLDKTEPPLVPYLGIFLTDITFISSGSPSVIDGLINFSKRKLLYNVVSKIQEYQRVRFKFHSVHQIQILFKKELPSKNDKELYKDSLKREPRN